MDLENLILESIPKKPTPTQPNPPTTSNTPNTPNTPTQIKTKLKPRMEYAQIKRIIEEITNRKHQALIAYTFAGCARIGEIVRNRYSKRKGITIQDVIEKPEKNKLYLRIYTEKINQERIVPISTKPRNIIENPPWGEKWLTDILTRYKNTVKQEEIFPHTTRYSQKIFEKYIGKYLPNHTQNIHLLRTWRATHYLNGQITGQKLPRQLVAKIGGWKSTYTLDSYYDLTIVEDYEKDI